MKHLKPLTWAGVIAGGLVILFGAARPAQPDAATLRAEPGHSTQLVGSIGLDSVLARACGDCHSNAMSPAAWPLSWAIARGAREGRKAVNFAQWSTYTPEQQRAFLVASCADAKGGRMPMRAYLRFRPNAKLSARDVEAICEAGR